MESSDIKFLKKRLKQLVESEQYEFAAIVKKWIDELSKKQEIIEKKTKRVF